MTTTRRCQCQGWIFSVATNPPLHLLAELRVGASRVALAVMAGLRLPARQAGDLPLQEVHQQLDQAASRAWRQPTPQTLAGSYAGWGGTRMVPGSHMAAILLPAQSPGLRATAARGRPAAAALPRLCSPCSASWSMLAGQYGWRLEQGYKQVKQELGWADFMVRRDRAIRRHWALLCCAFS